MAKRTEKIKTDSTFSVYVTVHHGSTTSSNTSFEPAVFPFEG